MNAVDKTTNHAQCHNIRAYLVINSTFEFPSFILSILASHLFYEYSFTEWNVALVDYINYVSSSYLTF